MLSYNYLLSIALIGLLVALCSGALYAYIHNGTILFATFFGLLVFLIEGGLYLRLRTRKPS